MAPISYISIKEAARLLGVSRQRVQELIQDDKLPATKLAGSTIWMIDEADIMRRIQRFNKKEVK
jgi:excisionase family DNA binding protein